MECVFCQIVSKEESADIIYEDNLCLAFPDRHPQTRGHMQLIPKKHYQWVYEMPDMDKLFSTAQRIIHAIIPVLGADHVTLATFGHQIRHAHIWIVPQYTKIVQVRESLNGRKTAEGSIDLAGILREAIVKEVS